MSIPTSDRFPSGGATPRSIVCTALLALLFLLVSYHFALNFARSGRYFLPIQDYADLRAGLPYQFRILMAPVFKALLQILDGGAVQKLFANLPPFVSTPEQLAYAAVNTAGLFCALILFHMIARTVFGAGAAVFWADVLFVAAVYAIFILNPNLNFILPYDLPSLALMQLCVLLILRERWFLLVIAFALATLNRETSFIAVVFLAALIVLNLVPQRRQAIVTAAVLTAVWVAIKLALAKLVTGAPAGGSGPNEGVVALLKLQYNTLTLLKPWQWAALLPLALPVIVALAALRGASREMLAWAGTFLLGFAALYVVAQITEQRAFGDLIGFAVVAMVMFFIQRGLIARGEGPVHG